MIRGLLRAVLLLGLASLAGCGGDDGEDASPDMGGGAGGAGGGAGGAGGGGTGCEASVPAEFAALTNPFAGDAAAVTAGESIYAGSCATCHGATGAGDGLVSDPPPTDFTAGDEERCDGQLFWRISTGAATGPAGSIMAAYSGALTDDQIWQVVTFLRTFEP